MSKHKVDLALVLPDSADACDQCIERLLKDVRNMAGVRKAHVDRTPAPVLCLHYARNVVRLESLERLVARAGAELKTRYAHLSVTLLGLRHERQAKLVEGVFARQPGVYHASVAFGVRKLYVEYDPAVTSRVLLLGVAAHADVSVADDQAAPGPPGERTDEHSHAGPFGDHSELVFALACGALTAVSWIVSKNEGPRTAAIVIAALAYVAGSWFTLQELLVAVRARRFEIDFLMLLAALGAAALGEWQEGGLLLFLFTLGHALEGFAMRRARRAISSLASIVPTTALRVEPNGEEREVPLTALRVGDQLIVKPNTRVPADGYVAHGRSSVNQAPITGESTPVDKSPPADLEAANRDPEKLRPEHKVFAGSINGSAALTIVATKAANDSTLARVVNMVTEAETQKSRSQRFTERFERIFVPLVLSLVIALLFAWVVVDEPFARSFYRAMAVLVAASPCALAIATPSAVLSGIARAARGGVLIKGGEHLETLGLVQAIAFDKTGTLTEGRPRLTDVRPSAGVDEAELLRVAAAIEKRSDHPLAEAIVAGARQRLGDDLSTLGSEDVEAIAGFGVRGVHEGSTVEIGKLALFAGAGGLPPPLMTAVDELQTLGRTVMIVRKGKRFLGVLGVMDVPRENAKRVIARLHELGVRRLVMLTGDHQNVANVVAQSVGVREAFGDLLPDQKVTAIAKLVDSTSPVAMVGDGVNDAPAMAHAAVGIAMGASGSDVALEAADVALMADDLSALPFAVGLSRAARRIIRQNLWASLGMVAVLVPATLFGFAGIGLAVLLHEGSTLLVVANALRLLGYNDNRREGHAA